MTQNKKKGIAKKALSISLVAAMLATSNVPAWASGFEAVDDGAGFTVEESAPVTEEVAGYDDTTMMQAANYTVKTNLALTTTDGTWATGLTLKAPDGETPEFSVMDSDNVDQTLTSMEVYINGSMAGNAVASGLDSVASINTALNNTVLGYANYNASVAVKFYVGSDMVQEFSCGSLKPVDISELTFESGKDSQTAEYNGKIREVDTENAIKDDQSNYVATTAVLDGTPKDVGTYSFQLRAADPAYTGTTKAAGTFSITAKTATATDVTAVISGSKEYTGAGVAPDVVVTDVQSGEVISSDFYNVTSTNIAVGEYDATNVTITFKDRAEDTEKGIEAKSANYTGTVVAASISGKYKITEFDLASLKDTSKYQVSIEDKELVSEGTPVNAAITDLTITDMEGGALTALETALGTGTTVVCSDNKTATNNAKMTITASAGSPFKGSVTLEYRIVKSTLDFDSAVFVSGKIGEIDYDHVKIGKTGTTADSIHKEIADMEIEYDGNAQKPLEALFQNLEGSAKLADQTYEKFKYGVDYDVIWSNNTDANVKLDGSTAIDKAKQPSVTIKFKGNYSGTLTINFNIKRAEVTAEPVAPTYEIGKTSYALDAKLTVGADKAKKEVETKNYTATPTKLGAKVGDDVETKIELTNKNYAFTDTDTQEFVKVINGKVAGKDIADKSITASVEQLSVEYTGNAADLKFDVKDNGTALELNKDFQIQSMAGLTAGTAKVVIKGIKNYAGTRTIEYVITKADLKNATVVSLTQNKDKTYNYDVEYTGAADREPAITDVKVGSSFLTQYNAATKTGDYILTYDKTAKNVGEYTFTITAAENSTKVQGTYTGTYKITPKALTAKFVDINDATNAEKTDLGEAVYTGKEITLNDLKVKYALKVSSAALGLDENAKLVEGTDYKLVYSDNTDAGEATVKAIGLGNYAELDADGKAVELATATFEIKGEGTLTAGDLIKINDAEYAGGLFVVPNVVVKSNGKTLVQDKDYTVTTTAIKVDNYTNSVVTVKGKGAYDGTATNASTLNWKVTAKDFKNCKATLVGKDVVVMNGSVIVPSSEYDVIENEDGSKTVKAKATSTNYTGEVTVEGSKAPKATTLKVTDRTTSTVSLAWDKVEGAEGYTIWFRSEYDSAVSRKIINGGDITTWKQSGLQSGTKYFYTIKAWVKTDAGYVFSEQSPTQRGTTKPMAAKIAKAAASNGKIKVTLAGKAAGAEMYSMCYADSRSAFAANNFKVGIRTSYTSRTLDKTFSKGTYYVCVKSYRDLGNGAKVYGAWSNTFKVVVK